MRNITKANRTFVGTAWLPRSSRSRRLLLAVVAMSSSLTSASAQVWIGPWDWAGCVNPTGACKSAHSEFSHAALIPSGPYRGKVLMWRQSVNPFSSTCMQAFRADAWIFDPLAPALLTSIQEQLTNDVFCSGSSWDQAGNHIIVGGNRQPTGLLSQAHKVRPGSLIGTAEAFTGSCLSACGLVIQGYETPPPNQLPKERLYENLSDMAGPRYYPTIIALQKKTLQFNTGSGCASIVGGAHLVLGGPESTTSNGGNSIIEFLPYGSSVWGCEASISPSVPVVASIRDSYATNRVFPDAPPSPFFDSYPRALQLSNADVLVLHDVETEPPTLQSPCSNEPNCPRDWWVFRLYGPYGTGTSTLELWRGHNTANFEPDFDRNYGTAVLLHQLNKPDRVLVFGGESASPSSGIITDLVQEFEPQTASGGLGGPVVNGLWHSKMPLSQPRTDTNGVILPTGEVLLVGGYTTAGHPVVTPELYDIGSAPNMLGSVTTLPGSNQVGQVGPTARLYHNVALLLPDGSVFLAGGNHPPPASQFADGEFSGEIFRPSYMRTQSLRPVIGSLEIRLGFNQPPATTNTFKLKVEFDASVMSIDSVVLTRPGAVTHFFDTDQRYIELQKNLPAESTPTSETYFVTSPDENLGPPGWYMVWVVGLETSTGNRIPSTAEFVHFQ